MKYLIEDFKNEYNKNRDELQSVKLFNDFIKDKSCYCDYQRFFKSHGIIIEVFFGYNFRIHFDKKKYFDVYVDYLLLPNTAGTEKFFIYTGTPTFELPKGSFYTYHTFDEEEAKNESILYGFYILETYLRYNK